MTYALCIAWPMIGCVVIYRAIGGLRWRLWAMVAAALFGAAIISRAIEIRSIPATPPGAQVIADRIDFGRRVPEVRP